MSHPIALPALAHDTEFQMGSYTGGDDGTFNPASYTRHFIGSPMSWRAGSFGAQFVPSQSPTAMLVGSYDLAKSPQDLSIMNAWYVFDHQGELCRNYTCCGTNLPDLHALLEHFEDVHIVAKDSTQPSIQIPFNPQILPSDTPQILPPEAPSSAQPVQPQYPAPFDTDDMDLGLDYDEASPPPPSTAPTSAGTSRAPSPAPSPSSTTRPALNISLTGVGFPFREGKHTPLSASSHTPFNTYARLNSAEYSPNSAQDAPAEPSQNGGAVAPALVFAEDQPEAPAPPASTSSQVPTAKSAKSSKRTSPTPASRPPSRVPTPSSAGPSASTPSTTAASSAHATIILPHKPFRCPKPHCSKSYKQANGLKYHMTHGSCSFGPAKDEEAVRQLLERKRANANQTHSGAAPVAEDADSGSSSPVSTSGGTALSQAEINEVEARMRPYACGVGDCSRRYKNMNGLRYHYQHSGDHGAVGLSLLAGGLHGCLKGNNAANAATASGSPSSNATAKGKGTGTGAGAGYAWGSTLLPHIQAVATTGSTNANTTASPTSTTGASVKSKGKTKTEGAAFTPPSPSAVPTTTTFSITSQSGAAPAPFGQGQQNDYLAQLQRAQYAQYQQWYAVAGAAQTTPTQQVDVTMG